jgi:molybdopterin-guanine dinucleotide biosynthesis protein A
MPHVDRDALSWLRDVASDAAIVAPRRAPDAPLEPLFARYDAPRVLPVLDGALAEGVRSFQALLGRFDIDEVMLRPEHRKALLDWDRPEDVDGDEGDAS